LAVEQTSDGGFIISGGTFSFSYGDLDVLLVKTNASGELEWFQHIGGADTDWGGNAQQTTDGGYIVTGYSNSFGTGSTDVYLAKTDSGGNPLWQRIFGGRGDDRGKIVQQTDDNGYVITGWTSSYGSGGYDVYLVKTDSMGYPEWERTFGGSGWDQGMYVRQTGDEGYIVVGWSDANGSPGDVYLVKTDSMGILQWQQFYSGLGIAVGGSVESTEDGGYIIGGATNSGIGGNDFYLLKTDGSGDLEWERTFGGNEDDWGWNAQQITDGSYVIVGVTESFGAGMSDAYLVKTDMAGNLLWEATYGGNESDEGLWVQQTTDGGYVVSGATWSFGAGAWDFYLIRLEPEVTFTRPNLPSVTQVEFRLEAPSPNPFNASTALSYQLQAPSQVSLNVYDTAGRLVATLVDSRQQAGTHEVTFDGSGLASGIYLAKLELSGSGATPTIRVQKLVLLK
jgi:hypothetical protein